MSDKRKNKGESVSLLTDRYELTMLSSLIEDGLVNRPAVFEAFARSLPKGRRYGVVAGLGRLVEMIEEFRFNKSEIKYLLETNVITEKTAKYLANFNFKGNVDAYREGELYFPYSPVVTVSGTMGECLILETLILSVLNFDSAIASAASRMYDVANGRTLIEMGSRRVHEQAAIAASRVAYIAGFDYTSNLAAGYKYGVPTVGTAAHAFTLAHDSEIDAFTSQVKSHGAGTTLLVDTYNIEQGIRNAVAVAGTDLGAIRLDSGDPKVESKKARALLDSLGAVKTRIVVTGDLDEFSIRGLADYPVDTYGVGTQLVIGSGAPTAKMVYKLVAKAESDRKDAPMIAVEKKSAGKGSRGGRKIAHREMDSLGYIARESIVARSVENSGEVLPGRPLQIRVINKGKLIDMPTLDDIRLFHKQVKGELRKDDRILDEGIPTLRSGE
jgi:nicotinate phosphoribosyltransferase